MWPSMVTHTQNFCSAFNPSKWTLTVVNTHPEQWTAIAAVPGVQLGVRWLAQGSHLSHGVEGGANARCSLPPPTIPASYERFEPSTSGYESNALFIRTRLCFTVSNSATKREGKDICTCKYYGSASKFSIISLRKRI